MSALSVAAVRGGVCGHEDGLSAFGEDDFRGRVALIQDQIHCKRVEDGLKAVAKKGKSESVGPGAVQVGACGVVEEASARETIFLCVHMMYS
ncbi:hypothetical protein BHU11_03020 [Tannerella sp. oral taxon 808]|nr:hypothetical protein BHU11_03020 [Tannerella sp. oral taxon 808]